ncbi:hypothetical protein ZL58_14310 [Salmonella enterica subsp. enterica serovar Typhimurium]|nr:hypothetical protein [Salmonella enterica subsp. enterica serovar Typhimurium]
MSKVYYTLKLREEAVLDGMVWEKLENGWYLSPDIPEEQAKAYLGCLGFRPFVVPAAPAAPAQAPKKTAVKKTTAKAKGGE